jgi:hypothetical protein
MIRTIYNAIDISEVPETWIFEHYCGLYHKLIGDDVTITSIFNPTEGTPSMKIFVSNGRYMYKDFSTGNGGNAINLVIQKKGISYPEAASLIVKDYTDYLQKYGGVNAFKLTPAVKFKLSHYEIRSWTKDDATFWSAFNIGSNMLEQYHIKPLASFTFEKEDGSVSYTKIKSRVYGYFREDGSLYKIYMPGTKKKFMKLLDYTQGLDQLDFKNPYLVICSSLKDAMCLKSFRYNIDVIAPDSENVLLNPTTIDFFKRNYKSIGVLLDNDEAGIKAMKKYEECYGSKPIHLTMAKDLSDAVQKFGVSEVRTQLEPLLKAALKK